MFGEEHPACTSYSSSLETFKLQAYLASSQRDKVHKSIIFASSPKKFNYIVLHANKSSDTEASKRKNVLQYFLAP